MAQIIIEAENYHSKSQWVNIQSDPAASNGQITGNLGLTGEWITYEINSQIAGTTDIVAWVKRAEISDSNVIARLNVNNVNYDVQVPSNAGIFPITFQNVAIPQGISYLKFSGVTGQSYKLDKIGYNPIPIPLPTPVAIEGWFQNLIIVTADDFETIYNDYGYKCQIYKNGVPFILAELYQEYIYDDEGDIVDSEHIVTFSPQPQGYNVELGNDGNMDFTVPNNESAIYSFKLIPRDTDSWHTAESAMSNNYVYTASVPAPPVPALSFDYGSSTQRYLSHPTKITSSVAGTIFIRKYDSNHPQGGEIVSSFPIQANETIKYNPSETGIYNIWITNANGSSTTASINYAYKGSDGYLINGVVTGSGNAIPAVTSGSPITVEVPATGEIGIGEGYIFCIRNEADNSIEIIRTNVSRGDTFQFTRPSSGNFQGAMFYPTAPTNLTEWNNLRQNQYLIQVTQPEPVRSVEPIVTTNSPVTIGVTISGTGVTGSTIKIYKDGVYIASTSVQNGVWSYTPVTVGTYTFSQVESGKTESTQTSSMLVNNAVNIPSVTKKTLIVNAIETCQNTLQYAIGSATETDPSNIQESAWQNSKYFNGLEVGTTVSVFARVKTKPITRVFLGTKTIL